MRITFIFRVFCYHYHCLNWLKMFIQFTHVSLHTLWQFWHVFLINYKNLTLVFACTFLNLQSISFTVWPVNYNQSWCVTRHLLTHISYSFVPDTDNIKLILACTFLCLRLKSSVHPVHLLLHCVVRMMFGVLNNLLNSFVTYPPSSLKNIYKIAPNLFLFTLLYSIFIRYCFIFLLMQLLFLKKNL